MDPIIEKIDRLAGEIAPITNYDGRARADLAKCALDTLEEIKRASHRLPSAGGNVRLMLADVETELKLLKKFGVDFGKLEQASARAQARLRRAREEAAKSLNGESIE